MVSVLRLRILAQNESSVLFRVGDPHFRYYCFETEENTESSCTYIPPLTSTPPLPTPSTSPGTPEIPVSISTRGTWIIELDEEYTNLFKGPSSTSEIPVSIFTTGLTSTSSSSSGIFEVESVTSNKAVLNLNILQSRLKSLEHRSHQKYPLLHSAL